MWCRGGGTSLNKAFIAATGKNKCHNKKGSSKDKGNDKDSWCVGVIWFPIICHRLIINQKISWANDIKYWIMCRCELDVDRSWLNVLSKNPLRDFQKGRYRGVFVEMGPRISPVSCVVANDPDVLVLAVDEAIITSLPLINHHGLESFPRNFRYWEGDIGSLNLQGAPILGACAFFPCRIYLGAKSFCSFLTKHGVGESGEPIMIVTESDDCGGMLEFPRVLECWMKDNSMKPKSKYISWKEYNTHYPGTEYSHILSNRQLMGANPTGVWVTTAQRTGWDILNWIVQYEE